MLQLVPTDVVLVKSNVKKYHNAYYEQVKRDPKK